MPHPITQPLRPLTDTERRELTRISHAPSERLNRHRRAVALLAVEAGKSLTDAAKAAGWKAQKTVTRLIRRFNERGLVALDDLPRSGHPRRYGQTERTRIIQELRRDPLRQADGTATWSLMTLRCALREASDGLPHVSTFTILYTLHEAGYSWQKSRTWCETGKTLRKKDGRVEESYDEYTQEKTAVIERAYLVGERLGFQVWCEDEAGPYQSIPQPGWSWQTENRPARQAYQYLRGETAKLLTLFRPATGELRAEAVQQSTNAILHPWLQQELTAILKQWLTDAILGWNRHPTPFIWGGKRHARRDQAYARRHRLGGSGATASYVAPRHIRSVRYYRSAA
jgi:transposase